MTLGEYLMKCRGDRSLRTVAEELFKKAPSLFLSRESALVFLRKIESESVCPQDRIEPEILAQIYGANEECLRELGIQGFDIDSIQNIEKRMAQLSEKLAKIRKNCRHSHRHNGTCIDCGDRDPDTEEKKCITEITGIMTKNAKAGNAAREIMTHLESNYGFKPVSKTK